MTSLNPKNISQNLRVKFHEIPSGGLDLQFSENVPALNNVLKDLLGDSPRYTVKLNLRPVEDMVNLRGDVATKLNVGCSRCGEDFSAPVAKKFIIAFYKSEDNIKSFSQDVELEGSFDLELLEGNEIDIGEVLHEQLALEIPFQPLCAESCKGLCTVCGTNLNESNCQCVKQSLPFAQLNHLIIGD